MASLRLPGLRPEGEAPGSPEQAEGMDARSERPAT